MAGGPPPPQNLGAKSWIGGLVFGVGKRTSFLRGDLIFGVGKRTPFLWWPYYGLLLWGRKTDPVLGSENGTSGVGKRTQFWSRKTDPVLGSATIDFAPDFSGGQVRHGRARRGFLKGHGRSRVWKGSGRHEEHRVSVGRRGMDGGVVPWARRGLMCFVVLLWWADGGARALGCAVLADRRAVTVCFGNRLE